MSDLLKIVLTLNFFEFAGQMYHQMQGTAMGTKMAPAYANLFMAEVEETLFQDWPIQPLLWKRYIDDILVIWPDSEGTFKQFVAHLNSKHPSIKFTHEQSQTSVDYLDVTIYKGHRFAQCGILDVKPFFKNTNKFQYLQYSSSHPKATFRSLLKGEFTRLLRACSDSTVYNQVVKKMTQVFRDRGYPKALIQRTASEVTFSNRGNMFNNTKPPCPYRTFMVMEYSPDLDVRSIKKALKPRTEETLVPKPCLSLKKAKNLGRLLVRAKLKGTSTPEKQTDKITIPWTPILEGRSARCGQSGCKCCGHMSLRNRVFSTSNYRGFYTAKHSNCSSVNVIYLIECKRCDKINQYVGQTRRLLSQRMGGHRAAAQYKHHLPLYKHFTGPSHNFERDILVSVLEKTTPGLLNERERYWIQQMDTIHPKGLNKRSDLPTSA